jgi:hypothetical protein
MECISLSIYNCDNDLKRLHFMPLFIERVESTRHCTQIQTYQSFFFFKGGGIYRTKGKHVPIMRLLKHNGRSFLYFVVDEVSKEY